MKLFYAPMACSLASRVLIREFELPVEAVQVSLATGRTADGEDFRAVHPLGLVPTLQCDDGRVLTENLVVLRRLAGLSPESGLLFPRDASEGEATLKWLSYTATEVHKLCLYPMFQRDAPAAVQSWSRSLLPGRLGPAAARLETCPWLAGEHFSVADLYFGWALLLTRQAGVDLSSLPALQRYWRSLMARPAFAATVEEEFVQYRSGRP